MPVDACCFLAHCNYVYMTLGMDECEWSGGRVRCCNLGRMAVEKTRPAVSAGGCGDGPRDWPRALGPAASRVVPASGRNDIRVALFECIIPGEYR